MTPPKPDRIGLDDLTDYAAGELSDVEAAALEEHLFSCRDCGALAEAFEALVGAVGPAIRSAHVGGIVTDAILNRLARDGVRVRSYTLSPGDIVPCAVWEDDEVMALRLRGDFAGVGELTLSQRVGGTEVGRVTGHIGAVAHREIIYAQPAAAIRELPVVEVEVRIAAFEGGAERMIGSYTLLHGGVLRRS